MQALLQVYMSSRADTQEEERGPGG